jgi:hypothetical protein
VSLALGPRDGRTELTYAVDLVREAAGERFDDLELAMKLLAAGDGEVPGPVTRLPGADVAGLAAAGSVSVLSGTPAEMADVLTRRRDVHGISYLSVNFAYAEALAPVVERLSGT